MYLKQCLVRFWALIITARYTITGLAGIREYPHTNRKKFYQINHLTIHNLAICPAAFEVIERLKKSVNGFR